MTARTILCNALPAVCPPRGSLFFVISSSPDEVSCSSSVVDAGAFLYPLVGGGDLYAPLEATAGNEDEESENDERKHEP